MDTDVAPLSDPVSPLLELGPPSPPPEDHPNQEQLPMEQLLHDDEPLAPLLMVAQPPIGFEDSPSKTKATSPPGMFTLFSSAICLPICKFSGGPNRTEFTEYQSFVSVLFGSVRSINTEPNLSSYC